MIILSIRISVCVCVWCDDYSLCVCVWRRDVCVMYCVQQHSVCANATTIWTLPLQYVRENTLQRAQQTTVHYCMITICLWDCGFKPGSDPAGDSCPSLRLVLRSSADRLIIRGGVITETLNLPNYLIWIIKIQFLCTGHFVRFRDSCLFGRRWCQTELLRSVRKTRGKTRGHLCFGWGMKTGLHMSLFSQSVCVCVCVCVCLCLCECIPCIC